MESINAAGKLLAKYEYDYEDNGNRKTLEETVEGTVYTTQYLYDPLNQIEKVINPDRYECDPAGNRVKMTRVEGNYTTTTKYEYNEVNELERLNVNDGPYTEFKYDKNGNRIAKIEPDNVVTTYTWDYENRLTEARFHQGKRVGFEYDGDGNRITKLSAMSLPTYKQNDGKGNDPGFTAPGQQKVKKQQADLQFSVMAKGGNKGGGSGGSGGGGGSSGSNGGGNSGGSKGNSGGNSGGSSGKGKSDNRDNGKSTDKVSNKPLNKNLNTEEREKKKQQSKAKKGYRQKGKYNNKGKHLGWYKNGKIPGEQTGEHVEVTYYLNDVSDPLTQVLMTSGTDGNFDAAYTYGLERIEVEALDNTRPESQDPLYYLYDGLGSVAYMVKPDGNTRDHYNYDEYGKPAPGNSKLSPDGAINLHNTFGYTGEMWDEESDLLYLRARYYEPETGRFLSRDTYKGTLEAPLSRNLYPYVENNPVNNTDPTGYSKYRARPKGVYTWITPDSTDYSLQDMDSLQSALISLKLLDKDHGINWKYDQATVNAVNKFKDAVMPKYNKGDLRGVVGPTTFAAILEAASTKGWKLPRPTNLPSTNNNAGSHFPDKGTGKTAAKAPTVTTNRSNDSNREAVKSGATDAAWYGADGAIEQGAKLLGRTISSQVGNVYSGVTTAFDVTKTWDNKNYTTSQKITKTAIQVGGGGVVVAGGTVIGDLAIGGAPVTGGGSIVVGAAGIAGLSSMVNKSQNWLYDKLGL